MIDRKPHAVAPDGTTPDEMVLPAHLGGRAAAPLLSALREKRGRDLRLNGADAGGIGAQCLQVLLSAHSSWARDGRRLWIADASAELLSTLDLFGVEPASSLLQPECHR